MNAVIMDDVIIGEECIIGALCFVPSGMNIPNRSLVVGNPAKIIKEVSDEMISWKTEGTALYQALPKECQDTLKECEPLREIEENRPMQDARYERWGAK
jgi:carbonic anhydrase/acetyltransferase-like protein (isoleucine patch superfamily)